MILKFDDRDGLKVISNESMDLNDPKELDGPMYSMIPVYLMDFDNP